MDELKKQQKLHRNFLNLILNLNTRTGKYFRFVLFHSKILRCNLYFELDDKSMDNIDTRVNLLEPEVEVCKSMESFLESAHSIAKTEEKTRNYSYLTIFSDKYMALRYLRSSNRTVLFYHWNFQSENYSNEFFSFVILLTLWVIVACLFNGLLFFVGKLPGNPFLNMLYSSIIDIISYILAHFITQK